MLNIDEINRLKNVIKAERMILYKTYLEMKESYDAKQLDKATVLSSMVYSIKCIIDDTVEQLKEIQ